MGRKIVIKNLSEEEQQNYVRDYHKLYYRKCKNELTKQSTIDNSIKRIMRSDKFIKQFLDAIGDDKICELLNWE